VSVVDCFVLPSVLQLMSAAPLPFSLSQGDKVGKPITRNCSAVSLSWRPNTDTLASGWQDGTVQIININNMQPKEDQHVHNGPVACLAWTADGKRLISGDQSGTVGVWKPDSRGRLTPICHYNKSGSIDHVVFVPEQQESSERKG